MRRDQRKDALELIVLSILGDDPLYGYAIIKRVGARSEGEIKLTPGVLYPLLHGLEADKLITSRWEDVRSDRRDDDDEGDGRRRKWYSITAKGKKRLAQRVRAHRAYQAMIDSFLPDVGGGAA